MKRPSWKVLVVAAAALYILLILVGGLSSGSTDGSSVVLVTDRAFYPCWWPVGYTLMNQGASWVNFGPDPSYEVNIFGLWVPGTYLNVIYPRARASVLYILSPGGNHTEKPEAVGFLLPGVYRIVNEVEYPGQVQAYGYFYVTDSFSSYILLVLFVWNRWRPTRNNIELVHRFLWVCGPLLVVWYTLTFTLHL